VVGDDVEESAALGSWRVKVMTLNLSEPALVIVTVEPR
jgi:hypothetical protein